MESARNQSSTIQRLPPQNIEAEQCVLGSILLHESAVLKAVELLSPDDFYRPEHRLIFTAMIHLFDKAEPQDLVTVTNVLKDGNNLDKIGGPAYLATLTDIVPVAANIGHYGKIVREKAILRKLISTSTEIASRCYEQQDDVDALLDETEQNIFDISSAKSNQSYYPISSVINESFKMVEKLSERQELITGVPSGFSDFDKLSKRQAYQRAGTLQCAEEQ